MMQFQNKGAVPVHPLLIRQPRNQNQSIMPHFVVWDCAYRVAKPIGSLGARQAEGF